jgi:4-amino-4-deoxy-L-arabinose transferase-like glycosyltransferase
VQFVQALIGGCTSILIFHLGKRYFGWLVGLLAGLAFAFWPIDWTVCARYVTEPLYVCLLVLSLVLLLRLIERPRLRLAALLGLIVGLASMVREVNILLIPILAAVVPLLPPAKGRRLKSVAALAVTVSIAALVMVPWIARGYRLTGSLVLPTTGGGIALMYTASMSEHPDYQGDLRDHARKVLWPEAKEVLSSHGITENGGDYDSTYWWTFMGIEDEVQANIVLREKALDVVRADPIRFLRTVGGNALGFWFRGASTSMSWLARLLFAPLLLMGAIGFAASVRSGQTAAWVLVLLIASLNLVCAPTVAFVRYTLPATPALLLLAARGLGCFIPAFFRHDDPGTSAAHELRIKPGGQ